MTPLVNTDFLNPKAAAARASVQSASVSSASITSVELLEWAEAQFPDRFPDGAADKTNTLLTYRYYPTTNTYLGVAADNAIYAYGSLTDNKLVKAGTLDDLSCTVKPDSCLPPPLVVVKEAFACAPGAITCLEIASTSSLAQASVPVTFGQPFKAGVWKHLETGLVAKDASGTIPLQANEISSHRDNSARFAVLSTRVTALQAGERRIVSLFTGTPSTTTAPLTEKTDWNLELQATIYSQQITKIAFGNRSGTTEGIPFLAGETIKMDISGPSAESYSLTVSAAQAGGGFSTLSLIAEAFAKQINTTSTVYMVERLGSSYERIWLKTRKADGPAFQVKFTYAGAAVISQQNPTEYQPPQLWTVKAQDLLKSAIATSNTGAAMVNRRLHGPVATEFNLVAPFVNASTGAQHPHLTARLDARLYEGGTRIRTDVVIENNWTFKADPRNITYELAIKQGGLVSFQQPAFAHYHHARWHKVVWSGTAPQVQVRHHMPKFMETRATWNYDLNLVVPEATLAAEEASLKQKRLEQAAMGPMGNVFLQADFTGTGGRPDIGPLPRWTALYLVTQDQRAYDAMMANADAAGAVPVHYRDESTQQPVDSIVRSTLSVYWDGSTVPTSPDPTIWAPDTAHQASFSYVPYLITGDRFYLDEAMFWATWNIFVNPPGYRSYALALLNKQQIRGQAWGLRSLGEAYRIVPDKHPMKPYYTALLDNNLAWYNDNYLVKKLGHPMGAVEYSTSASLWQNDFFGTVFALLAENDDPHAKDLHNWFSNFGVGRFLSESQGYCTARASSYHFTVKDDAGLNITTWAGLFARNMLAEDAGKPCNSLTIVEGYPDSASSYAAYGHARLGAAANAGYPGAIEAYNRWKSMTPAIPTAFAKDPTWAIVPR